MFRAPCAHRQEVKIVLYSLWYHHTYRWPSRVQVETGLDGMHGIQLYAVMKARAQILCTGRPPIGVMIPETL